MNWSLSVSGTASMWVITLTGMCLVYCCAAVAVPVGDEFVDQLVADGARAFGSSPVIASAVNDGSSSCL